MCNFKSKCVHSVYGLMPVFMLVWWLFLVTANLLMNGSAWVSETGS